MVSHGTRSAYNRGCRCDACREASRLARARQRSAAGERQSASVVSDYRELASPSLWILIAGLAGGSAWSFWHASRIDSTQSPEAATSRRNWRVAGILLGGSALGLVLLCRSVPDGT